MIFAYACEGLFGLGCDPFSKKDVQLLCSLKKRDISKGLILVSGQFDHFKPFIEHLNKTEVKRLKSKWPGPFTWLIKANEKVPEWIRGDSNLVALRQSSHPSIKKLTDEFGGVVTSTSANIANEPPAVTTSEVKKIFGNKVKIIPGQVGSLNRATPIRNLHTLEWVRK